MNRQRDEILAIANSLSNDDLCLLLNVLGDRVDIYLGLLGRVCIETEFSSACLNGARIQVNTTLSDLDDVREDRQIQYALRDESQLLVESMSSAQKESRH